MSNSTTDSSFSTEQDARDYAEDASSANHNHLHIILAGDEYFVTSTKNVQSYEKLIASYVNGHISK